MWKSWGGRERKKNTYKARQALQGTRYTSRDKVDKYARHLKNTRISLVPEIFGKSS